MLEEVDGKNQPQFQPYGVPEYARLAEHRIRGALGVAAFESEPGYCRASHGMPWLSVRYRFEQLN